MTLFDVFLVLAGLVIGSAIDAAADRYAQDEPWTTGRSRCRGCGRRLSWFELVPLASWLVLRGRCRTCRALIGLSSPVTELAGGAVALSAVLLAPTGYMVFTVTFGWLLLALAAIDLRTFLLPDPLNAAVLLLGGVMLAWTQPATWPLHLAGAALGYAILWLVETAYRQLRGRDGLGRGDAKLLGAVGIWVSAIGLAPVLLIASLGGIAAALIGATRSPEGLSGQSAIAFGPWIALGGYVVWLLNIAAPLMNSLNY